MWSVILLIASITARATAYEGAVWGAEPGLIVMADLLPKVFDLTTEEVVLLRSLVKEEADIVGQLKPVIRSHYISNPNYRGNDIIELYRKHNITHYMKYIQGSARKYRDAIKDYDDITRRKMDDFYEELVQAMFCNDEYHVSYFLLHYLHLRAGLGLARIAVRKLYPNCEKFAQIPEVKKFYMQHRGENPRSLTTLKEFSELINWLKFEGKLKIEGKSLTAAFHRANHNVPQ